MAGGLVSDPRKGRAPKAPPPEAIDPNSYRLVTRDPWGEVESILEGPLATILERHAEREEAGLDAVIEYRLAGTPWMRWRRPLLIADLAREGLAHQEEGRWVVEPGGWRRLRESQRS